AIANAEALERLNRIADFFLFHDREILQRCDDSVARVMMHKPVLIRRSRGYAPEPVHLACRLTVPVLACGGELKNTIALARDRHVFLSQHIGDLNNPPALAFFQQTIEHLQQVLEIEPAVIACDLHPDYLSTQWARKQKKKPLVGVQHHHGHLVSVMAENRIIQPCIGIILDGSGYGLDGTIWGGEVLIGDAHSYNRFAWLQPVPMPGGEAAVRQPWRMTTAYLDAVYGRDFLQLDLPLIHRHTRQELMLIMRMMETGTNCPLTSSCGRLFDATAGLLGLRCEISYEAQAAVELEMLADDRSADPYPTPQVSGPGALATDFLIRRLVEDWSHGAAPALIAQRFHATVAEIFLQACRAAREKTGITLAALSGGVFQNRLFFHLLHERLQKEGFLVISHHLVPTNDGGLALGQAVIAAAQVQNANKIKNHYVNRV
ncbi:carbamoyltransferase HypF, partial [bacterium]|nr:carbamoyltransferase HypF [bacterium]